MTFKHFVGKSTLKEGITIHKNFEIFFESPELGSKKEIRLLFGEDQFVNVTLRRLNNIRKHVQIKYTSKTHAPLINWLNNTFVETQKGTLGEFLEFQKISKDVFRLKPITIKQSRNAQLYIADSMYYKTTKESLKNCNPFNEVEEIINSIKFSTGEGQAFYNKRIEEAFSKLNWTKEGRAIPELDLKYDFRKNKVQIEVEFGNARAYYQNYIKFMLSYFSKQIQFGMLITPTLGFANILCEIGKQKALQKGRKTYSGMIHFEKVYKEFHYLKPIFDMPIVILGIDINPS